MFCIISALLLMHVESGAQSRTVKKFSPNTDSTVVEMTAFLTAVSKSYNKDADTLVQFFSEHWPEWSSAQQVSFLQLANQMLQKRLKPFPHFKAFIHTYNSFVGSMPNKTQEKGFCQSMSVLIGRSSNQFEDMMVRYEKIITEKEINSFTSTVHWYARNSMNYQFVCDSLPKIFFPYLDLVGTNGKDSVVIHQTSGNYDPINQKFYGKDGVVDWIRAGLAPNEIYVEIKQYAITLKAPNISIENVLYYDFRYFEKPQLGRLEDKASNTPLTEEGATYPRFASYDRDILIHGLYEDVDYRGGVFVRGNRFLGQGTPDHMARLVFYREGKPDRTFHLVPVEKGAHRIIPLCGFTVYCGGFHLPFRHTVALQCSQEGLVADPWQGRFATYAFFQHLPSVGDV